MAENKPLSFDQCLGFGFIDDESINHKIAAIFKIENMDIIQRIKELGLKKAEPTPEIKAEAKEEVKAIVKAAETPAEALTGELVTKAEMIELKKTFENFIDVVLAYIESAPTAEDRQKEIQTIADATANEKMIALLKAAKSTGSVPMAREMGFEKSEDMKVTKQYGPLTLGDNFNAFDLLKKN